MSFILELVPGNNIIDELLGYDTKFKDIRMYGTREDPLFYTNDLASLLGIKNIRVTIKNYGEEFIKRKCSVELIIKTKNGYHKKIQKVNMLTETGLYKLICSSKSEIANELIIFI